MQPSKYNIPADPAAQKALLKDLLSGKKSMDDLIEDTLDIQLNLHPSPEEREQFAANMVAQDSLTGPADKTYFTISMPVVTPTQLDPSHLQAALAPVVTDKPLPKPVNRPEPGPNQASDSSYWDSLWSSSGSDRLDSVSNHLHDIRNK